MVEQKMQNIEEIIERNKTGGEYDQRIADLFEEIENDRKEDRKQLDSLREDLSLEAEEFVKQKRKELQEKRRQEAEEKSNKEREAQKQKLQNKFQSLQDEQDAIRKDIEKISV